LAVENGFPVVLYADDGPAFREDDLSAFSALDSFRAPADWTRAKALILNLCPTR